MSVQRTPERPSTSSNMARSPEATKRQLSDSAPPNADEKRRKEAAEAPSWSIALFGQMNEKMDSLAAKVDGVEDKLSALDVVSERVDIIEDDVARLFDEVANINISMKTLQDANKLLRAKVKELEENKASKEEVAKNTDSSLRNTITVCGVAMEGPENHWELTKAALARALTEITPEDYTYKYWFRAIQRAHRGKIEEGKIPIIHAIFVSWADKDYVCNLFLGDNPAPNPRKLEIYKKHSKHTEARIKLAVERRKQIREHDKMIKSYVKYPADLMVKKVGEKRYTCVQKF